MMKIYCPDKILRTPDAVLFDTDNTLYHYDPAHAAAMNVVEKKVQQSLSISPVQFKEAFRQARSEVKARLGETASSHSRLLYFQRMLEIIGLGSQVLLALDFEQTYWRTFLSHATLFEGVKELLDELRLLGIPVAIVTDLTAQIQFRKIVYFGLDHYFDYIITSEEAGFDKPNPAPFLMAIEKMRPQGHNIWMIGDNAINDVRGAREAIGAVTFQKIHDGVELGSGENQPDVAFSEVSQLISLLHKTSMAATATYLNTDTLITG